MQTTDRYDHDEIERKWRSLWDTSKLDVTDILHAKRPFYNLMMFPYPSAEGLHVGNMYAFTGSDIFGRFKQMQGYDVFEPIGLDGFGIHSENFALKIGRHPMDHAAITEKNYYNQLHKIGAMYDWTRTVQTYHPDYYRWTQWLFVQMFKHGLAYRGKAQVNWCPGCKTVLADEQVVAKKVTILSDPELVEGESKDLSHDVCERCGNIVEKKQLEQWFFKITAYAEKLLQNSYTLDWSEKIRVAQQAWIGKKEGYKIKFGEIEVFTTRPDTIFGATFVVLSPNHPLAGKVKNVVNPATNKEIAVFVDEYVIGTVGTGAIMGVPAYDERDRAFAKRMGLPVVRVALTDKIFGEKMVTYHLRDWLISRQRYWGPPIPMIKCPICSWQPVPEKDLPVILPRIEDYKPGDDGVAPLAKHKEFYETTCPKCRGKAVRETDVSDTFLDSSWYFFRYPSVVPVIASEATKQSPANAGLDTQSGEIASSKTPRNDKQALPWDPSVTKRWLPVHMYTGGAEHSVLHLMYSRFITMALRDFGYIDWDEPFTKFYAHGLVIKDGAKMSKSKGNVVNPDEYIAAYGADALRLYLMFTGPYDQGGDFRDSAMEGMSRWVQKVWRFAMRSIATYDSSDSFAPLDSFKHSRLSSATVKKALHRAIKKVGEDLEHRRYNTAIAIMMEFVNTVTDDGPSSGEASGVIGREDLNDFLKILAPFAPFMTEELYQRMQLSFWQASHRARPESGDAEQASMTEIGSYASQYTFTKSNSIHFQPWPVYDPKLLEEDTVRIAVQVNGKLRDTIVVKSQSFGKAQDDPERSRMGQKSKVQGEVEAAARRSDRVRKHLEGKSVKKVIFVPGKIINFVV
ncbi:leucine--tRNA ligase [Candidatus Gottesmanbacteria bacterium]|nr:leucine--tRNA ligase [Candidatus Gottesmanbacteria bacterium]